jgi:hypothetical protein
MTMHDLATRRSLSGRAASLVAAGALVVVSTVRPSTPATAAEAWPDTVAECQAMFDNKNDSTWRAADGNLTVGLPNGKIAWLFGDTLREGESPVRNSVLVQEGSRLTSPTGGQAIPNDGNGDYYWPTDAIMDGGLLRAFVGRLGTVNGAFESHGMALATFTLDSRGYPVYSGNKLNLTSSNEDVAVQWGTSTVRDGSYVYVYGQQRRQGLWIFGRDVYLARVPVDQLVSRSSWRYWTGSGWVSDQTRATRIEQAESGRFASSFSVDKVGGKWVVISKEADFLGNRIIRMEAESPMGPFTIKRSISTPGTSTQWAYQAKGHPELPLATGKLLVTWNLGSSDPSRLLDKYFPKPKCGQA